MRALPSADTRQKVTGMGLFGRKKKPDYPVIDLGRYEPALRCSICTGEQVLVAVDRQNGKMHELMLIRSPGELEAVCEANGIAAEDLRKIY